MIDLLRKEGKEEKLEEFLRRTRKSTVSTAVKIFSRFFPDFSFRDFVFRSFHFQAFVIISASISAVFNLPTIASGQGANAQAFSSWYQFGNGIASKIHKGHGRLSAAFESNAPYNNHAGIYYVTLEAYDFSGEYDICD
jgi:hypothetical protein